MADMRLQLAEAQADPAQAIQWAHTLLESDPPWLTVGSPGWAKAHSILGQEALDREAKDEARTHFEAVMQQGSADPSERHGAVLGWPGWRWPKATPKRPTPNSRT
jgi:hypothetical protein